MHRRVIVDAVPTSPGGIGGGREAARLGGSERGGELGPKEIERDLTRFFAEHSAIRTDPGARSPALLKLETGEWSWEFAQVLLDPEEHDDWVLSGSIDLEASRTAGSPAILLRKIGN